MASLSILRLLLRGVLLIPFHLTLTSAQEAFGCPPKDPFDWESVRVASFCMRGYSNRA